MAHFAKLDENNVVLAVHRVHNNELLDDNGVEQEAKGAAFLTKLHGHTKWKQCSYNTLGGNHKLGGTPKRKNYAGAGYTYDEGRDAFIGAKTFPSWVLDETTCQWKAPSAEPVTYTQQVTDLNDAAVKDTYEWDEPSKSWRLVYRREEDIRKNHIGKPYTNDPNTGNPRIPPKPYASWIWNESLYRWEPPTPYPDTNTQNRKDYDDSAIPDGYAWNETTKEWDLTSSPSS